MVAMVRQESSGGGGWCEVARDKNRVKDGSAVVAAAGHGGGADGGLRVAPGG